MDKSYKAPASQRPGYYSTPYFKNFKLKSNLETPLSPFTMESHI